MAPYIKDSDFTLYVGDALTVLRELPDKSVDSCITSPPYFGLRNYGDDAQIGLENTPQEYIERLVSVFHEVRRVLADHGTIWINIGDSYVSNASSQVPQTKSHVGSGFAGSNRNGMTGLEPKNLIGVPWRLAFALQNDGWYLRSDIIWSKPNVMPESVTDRPTKSHEYIFLLSKRHLYHFDQDAIREPHTSTRWGGPTITQPSDTKYAEATANGFAGAAEALSRPGREWNAYPEGGRNIRTVWEIPTKPYSEAHFAAFPEELVRRCLLAGCPDGGTVLDPFGGSGTTALVARKHARKSVLIELNPEYCELAAKRLQQLSLLTEIS